MPALQLRSVSTSTSVAPLAGSGLLAFNEAVVKSHRGPAAMAGDIVSATVTYHSYCVSIERSGHGVVATEPLGTPKSAPIGE